MTILGLDKLNSYFAVLPASTLDDVERESLIGRLWGASRAAELMPLLRQRSNVFDLHVLLHQDWRVIGHAKIFRRSITIGDDHSVNANALSCVFVLPEYRGQGYGTKLVLGAFAYSGNVFMWQTTVPGFYTRLGARILRSQFVDQPWTDPYVMVYPSSFEFGEGKIDIQGEAW